MWKPPSYDHRFDTAFYEYGLRTQHYLWMDYAPDWYRRLYWRLNDAYWFLQHRLNPRHRYHIINTGLGYGFRDTDSIMEAVLVKLFVKFIEVEKPFDHFDTTQPSHAAMWAEMKELYEFFVQHDWRELENDVLTEKLHAVIDLRSHMWT